MPTRDIKESCRTSPTLAQLTHGAERLFWRMTTCADDYGRMPADADIVRAECFPRQLGKILSRHVDNWLEEMRRVKLVACYIDSAGHHLLFFLTWRRHQRQRAAHSKYEAPTSANTCQHMTAYAGIRSGSTETTEDTVNTENTGRDLGPPATRPSATPAKPIPESIQKALQATRLLNATPKLWTPEFWQASIRATNGHVEYAQEVLKAEAWLTANQTRAPRKDLARFLHNWLSRAGERA